MMMGVMLFCFAQEHIPFSQYYVAPEFTEEFGASKVEDLRANQPAELVRMHYTMFNYALVVSKLWDGNFQEMGMLEKYLPEGIGTTWDTYDDVTEEEADTFNWSFDGSRLIQEHHMVVGIVPRILTVTKLDPDSLVYQDSGGLLHHFHRNVMP